MMRPAIILTAAIALLVLSVPSPAALGAAAVGPQPSADKVAVVDGHVIHSANTIANHVSNWGLIGSWPGLSTPFSDVPSGEWPQTSGRTYLWGAGLWIGGIVDGERRVTTAGFTNEFLPTEADLDTIYRTRHGAPGGNRFPWPDADDDADGREDEEWLNGVDDDGDGLVDEDFAGIGDEHFVCAYDDFEPGLAVLPDHVPLGVRVVAQSIAWNDPLVEDMLAYDFTITNEGEHAIEQVYLGMFSDFDIGLRGTPGVAEDDAAGWFAGDVTTVDGTAVPVRLAYMRDVAWLQPLGYAGWVLCSHDTDSTGIAAPAVVDAHAFRHFSGNAAYGDGGDPTNDAERYEALATAGFDPDVPDERAADYRVLMSCGQFPTLLPGESLTFRVAMVFGLTLGDLVANAAEAARVGRGHSFDRDGDPANGEEFLVPWLLGQDVPVAAIGGRLLARATVEGVELTAVLNAPAAPGVAVVRRPAPGLAERRWELADLAPQVAGEVWTYRVHDEPVGGWAADYALVQRAAGRETVLAEAAAAPGVPGGAGLRAEPNPFNPTVNLEVSLPRAGPARLGVYDLRGRLVATLVDGVLEAGVLDVAWHGRDDAGRAMPSGIYLLRLEVAGEAPAEARVTLLR